MRLFSRLTNGIRALLRRGIADEELDAELHAFLEAAVDEQMRSGMSREEATRAARLETGLVSADSVKRAGRTYRIRPLEAGVRDARYGARVLWRSPGYAEVVIVALTLGIG